MATSTRQSTMRWLLAAAIVRHLSYRPAGCSTSMPDWEPPCAAGFGPWSPQPPARAPQPWSQQRGWRHSQANRTKSARLLAQLSTLTSNGALPDGTKSVESVVALIRGLFGFGGPSDMLASARRAAELETDGNTPWYAVATTALGHASYVIGDLDTAARVLPNAAYSEAAPSLIRIMALASLSLTQAELGQFDRSRKSAEESMEVVEARSLHALPSGSMAFTALGQSQAASGQLTEAMATLEQGLNLLRKNPGLSPWPMIHHLLVDGTRGDHVGRSAASTAAP